MSNASSKPAADRNEPAAAKDSLPPEQETQFQARTTQGKVGWSPWAAVLVAVAVYFGAQIVASLLVLVYPLIMHWSVAEMERWLTNSILAQFSYFVAAEALTLGAIVWFIRSRKTPLSAIGLRWPKLGDIAPALAAFFVYFVVYAIVLAVAVHLVPGLNVNQKQDTGFQTASGFWQLGVTFISLVVLPPVVEEIVFRGFVFGGLRSKLRFWGAAALTSLLFASAHLQLGSGQPLLWVAALDTLVLSMVLCYTREKTGSIVPGMFVHALKNGIAFVGLFILHVK